jgi:hypothetical protein
MTRTHDARIGDQQHPTSTQARGQFTQPIQTTGSEHQASPQGAVERGKDHDGVKTLRAGGIFKPGIRDLN